VKAQKILNARNDGNSSFRPVMYDLRGSGGGWQAWPWGGRQRHRAGTTGPASVYQKLTLGDAAHRTADVQAWRQIPSRMPSPSEQSRARQTAVGDIGN